MQNPSAEANQQEFQDEQLKLLDSISDERPENVLEAAKRINLITDEIHKKIERDLPNHVLLFQRNLAKEASRGAPDTAAFRRAFMTTYGKFLFEQSSEITTEPDGVYLEKLRKVLGPNNKIDERGLKGRSELQAAGAMLHMMTSSEGAKADVKKRITAKETEKTAEEGKRPPLEADNTFLDTKSTEVDAVKLPADFEASVAQLNIASENREYVDKMGELRDMLDYFEATVRANLVASAPDSADKITTAINIFNSIVSEPKIDIAKFKKFLEENVKPLLRELRKEKPYKGDDGKYPDDVNYRANLKTADDSFKFLNKDKNVKQLETRKTNTKDADITASGTANEYECFRKENTSNFEDRYNGFKAQLDALNPAVEALRDDTALDASVSGFKQKCIDYLTAFATFQGKAAADLTPAEVKAFIDTTFKPFVESLKQLIADKKLANNQALSQVVARISAIDADITKLKAFNGTIIERNIQKEITETDAEKKAAEARIVEIDSLLGAAPPPADPVPLSAEKAELTAKVKSLEDKLIALKTTTPLQRILQKAFPGVSPKAKQEAQRAVEDAKKNLEKGKKAREYFADSKTRKEFEAARQKLDRNSLTDPTDTATSKKLKLKDASGTETEYSYLDVPLDITIQRLEEEIKERRDTRDRKDRNGNYVETNRDSITLQISEKQKHLSELNALKTSAKALYTSMKNFGDHVANLIKLKIISVPAGATDIVIILKELEAFDVDSPNLKCKELIDIYAKLNPYYIADDLKPVNLTAKFDEGIPKLEDQVKKAEEKVASLERMEKENKNLTDPKAAKKIVSAIIAEQFPDMPLEEQQKLATLILAENVSTIQTLESYDTLAQRGSAELLNTVQAAAIKQKLIGLEFQVGDKAEHPFKGLKPENFSTPAEIEKLFASGRLNHQNGFLVLAAFEDIGGANCEQANYLRKRLKTALAEKLKVKDKMDEAGKNRIVDKAFEKSLKKARAAYKAYSDHFDANKDTWNLYSVQELDTKFDKLEELHRLGMKDDIYYKRRAELLKEAREAGVEDKVKFAEDSALAGYWSGKESQWLKDRGYDIGAYAGRKALAVGKMGLGLTGRALWGATKVGAGLTYQLGIATPLRFGVKYPLMIAGKVAAFPFRMINNFFRKTKWNTPFKLGQTVKVDLAKTFNFFPETAGKVAAGAKASLKEVPKKEWGEAKWKGTKYKERTKVDQKEMDERIKELGEKAKKTPVVLGESPYIDLTPFEKEIEMTDKMLAGTSAGSHEEVKKAA